MSSGAPTAPTAKPRPTRRARERGRPARPRQRGLFGSLRVADDVHVDPDAGLADDAVDHRAMRQLAPARAAGGAEHDLGRVEGARELEQRLSGIRAGDLTIGAAELFDQAPLAARAARPTKPPGRPAAARGLPRARPCSRAAIRAARRTSRSPSDDPVRATTHPLTRLPGPVDPVSLAVRGERLVDAVGEPEQCELAESAEVAGPEVVAERHVDPLGRVDVAVRHPPPDRLGGHVDKLDLLGTPDDLVWDRLPLLDPGDLFDDVVERFEMLDVQRRDDRDPGVEQLLDVLPALLVARARDIRVGELVDERDFGPPGQHRVDVHLFERCAAVGQRSPRHELEVAELGGGLLAARASRRSQPRRRSRGCDAGAPHRASQRSCRHRGRRRGRCGASLAPCPKATPCRRAPG